MTEHDETLPPYTASTRVLRVSAQSPEPAVIATAAAVLRAGGLVAFPTETVYGLGANALDARAVERIFRAKGRPANDPVIVHIAQMAQLAQVARAVPPLAEQLAAAFFPGALTLVLHKSAAIPPGVTAGSDTVGVRMPSHPVAHALITAAGVPVAAPSANLFSRPSPTSAAHVLDDLRGRVDVVLDGGSTPIGLESTIVDLTQTPPVMLRPGGIPLETLAAIIPDLRFTPRYLAEGAAMPSPGTLLKHYSPRAEVRLFSGTDAARVLAAIWQQGRALQHEGKRVGLLLQSRDAARLLEQSGMVVAQLGDDLPSMGEQLFAALRELDAAGVDVILVRAVEQQGVGLAIWDRLVRAAEGRVIAVE